MWYPLDKGKLDEINPCGVCVDQIDIEPTPIEREPNFVTLEGVSERVPTWKIRFILV